MQPKVAVIILNWNGLQDTLECLESVFQNSYPNYSLYMIDNASKEDELGAIKGWKDTKDLKDGEEIHFIQNAENLGFAEGNNVGIRKALEDGAEYIFTLNNDTVVDPNFLNAAVETAMSSGAGIVATTMVNYYHRTKLDNTGHLLLTTGDTVPRNRGDHYPPAKGDGKSAVADEQGVMGACAGAALYSSSMLKKIGLFDKDFFLNYEDSDLSLRGIVQGWSCVYSPSSIVYHKLNASIGKIKNSGYRIRSQRNQLWAYFHNTPLPVMALNLPWIILREILVPVLSLLTFRWTVTRIIIGSRWEFLKSLPGALKKRRKVLHHKKISSWWYWSRQTSCLSTYWKYFKAIVIKRRDSVMD